MFDRLRNGVLAGSGALLLVLTLSGTAMGASLTSDSGPVAGTAFVDVDGDGVADHCQTEAAVESAEAAQAAFEAADTDGDGQISVTEAAHSEWVGGLNCNHGGYVSEVSQDDESTEDTEEQAAGETETETAEDETCEAVAAPELDPATDTNAWNHGDWVTWVAKSEATGGENCNHGGAVSEASKAANEAAKAERAAARAERDARKAEKKAARDLKKQERQAAKANKGHGKPN